MRVAVAVGFGYAAITIGAVYLFFEPDSDHSPAVHLAVWTCLAFIHLLAGFVFAHPFACLLPVIPFVAALPIDDDSVVPVEGIVAFCAVPGAILIFLGIVLRSVAENRGWHQLPRL